MNDFKFKILRSSEVDQQTEQDIMNCFNKTFDQKKSNLYFNWKFRENPFGDSIHVLIYFKDDLISTLENRFISGDVILTGTSVPKIFLLMADQITELRS